MATPQLKQAVLIFQHPSLAGAQIVEKSPAGDFLEK
jgi:hypothetical protein